MSSQSTIPFFGQAWELVVALANGTDTPTLVTVSTDAWEPEALRITFEVQNAAIASPWWYADISIFNLDTASIQSLLFNATWVTLKAGFQTGPTLAATIWDGPILQVLYDQEAVVDQRITLHCVANPLVMNEGVISFALGVYASQAQLLAQAAAAINLPTIAQAQGTLSSYAQQVLSAKAYPRGNTVFGTMGAYLDQVANDQFLQTFRDGYQAYMTDLGQPGAAVPDPDFIYSPSVPFNTTANVPADTTPTIIGTPRQTPTGVIFSVLLDPRLKAKLPVQVVRLIRTLPGQTSIQPSPADGNLGTPLNSNLTFFVSQVKHVGDSRGNDWYTEVTGYSTNYGQQLLDGVFSASSSKNTVAGGS